jgi:phage shock protein C
MYCNYCGKVIQDDANVCAYCGRRVGAVLARRKLVRPRQDRKIAGVCAGLAEYFDLDVTLIRLVWLVAGILMIPFSLIAYVVGWIIIPEEPEVCFVVPAGSPASPQQG